MKFVLHEIRLWFRDENAEPKSYFFLANKINVVTGDSTTGKTSFWNIIDYCLLSGKVTIANTIIEKVLWFGIRFTINDKEISIVRKTPINGAVSSEVYFNIGALPDKPESNITVSEIKSKLDEEYGITDALRFPYGKESGKSTFNLSYRHFLLFNSLTQTIIDAPETYFDTTFYGKDEYDEALGHIFDLVIGVNDLKNIKAKEKLKEIEAELKKIQNQEIKNQRKTKNFELGILRLIEKCKKYNFIDYSEYFENVNDEITVIQEIITSTRKVAKNAQLFNEIDNLYKRKNEIQAQINAINQYQKEFDLYKKNLDKSADSLQPIEFLNQKLSDQLIDSYETKIFIESLESSLKNIRENLSKKITKPLKVSGDIKELRGQLQEIDKRISQLNEIKKNYLAEGEKFIALGEIKHEFEQIQKEKLITPIDTIKLNKLNEEKGRLASVPAETEQIKYTMKTLLNESIQRNYSQLKSLTAYNDYRTVFDDSSMILKLYPPSDQLQFPLENVGSASNYMFMHLCVYLGLHEHVIKIQENHIPKFLFIFGAGLKRYHLSV